MKCRFQTPEITKLLRFAVSAVLAIMAVASVTLEGVAGSMVTCSGIVPMRYRSDKVSITDFGGVGDGRTVNTKAFREATYRIQHLRRRGGTLLYIPPGVYLTGSFSLTSHMTLYLARGAVIKATQDTWNWPLIPPLPSYGRGRERPGRRYMSLIQGYGLRDVIITGENGTIDGQGEVWWNMWRQGTLRYTRPHLVEFIQSRSIMISNVVFKNSPFWNIHPVYCSNVVIRYVTILAPYDSPNTDGIDPGVCFGWSDNLTDSFFVEKFEFSGKKANYHICICTGSDSSSNVCIEDSHISVGDDLVSVKSGWDEYGIRYGRRSSWITIRRITGSSPFAGISVGSEMSGGVENVLVEDINLYNMGIGIHIKTNVGRGGFIKGITVSNVYMENVRKGIRIVGDVGDHPDDYYNPYALPYVKGIRIKDVWGLRVQEAGSIQGLKNSPFTGICLSNIYLHGMPGQGRATWTCSDVTGAALEVSPWVCSELARTYQSGVCSNPFRD